jgi:hypothetical protein
LINSGAAESMAQDFSFAGRLSSTHW